MCDVEGRDNNCLCVFVCGVCVVSDSVSVFTVQYAYKVHPQLLLLLTPSFVLVKKWHTKSLQTYNAFSCVPPYSAPCLSLWETNYRCLFVHSSTHTWNREIKTSLSRASMCMPVA